MATGPGMPRKERVKKQLDDLAPEKLKFCRRPNCVCTGCVNTVGVSSAELKVYLDERESSKGD